MPSNLLQIAHPLLFTRKVRTCSKNSNVTMCCNEYECCVAFWEMVTADWLALYIAPPTVFVWFRDIVLQNCKDIHIGVLHKLILALMPWRRELQNKFFDPRTQHTTEIIDFTVTNVSLLVLVSYYSCHNGVFN